MRNLLSLILLLFSFYFSNAQTTLVLWNFGDSNTTADGGITPNLTKTLTNTASGTATFPSSTSGTCTSPYILNTGWDAGTNTKYWAFNFVSTNYNTLTISYDQRSSGTGPGEFKVEYSITSSSSGFVDISGTYSIVGTSCSSYSYSLPADANNLASVWIRITVASTTSQNGGTVANTGTSGLDNLKISAAISLPITLSKFNAFFQNKQVNLTWSKGDANNFDKFVVEHSTNGVDFVAIEEIASRNSDDYATIHSNPAKGNNYYRLKMMDLDGSFRYSDTKTVTVKGAQEWSVYPTKATAMITASVSENEEATVQILNTNGQVMYTVNSNVNALVELPISNLSQGLYLVQIIEKGAVVFTERIIKE